MKKKAGFTLIELLVVMVIIAVLAGLLMPVIRKGRARALVDKATAEMAGLASTMSMVKLDTGLYIRLCDLADPQLSDPANTFAYYNTTPPGNDDTGSESGLTSDHNWSGPYQVFQSKSTYLPDNGSVPSCSGAGSGVGSGWDEDGDKKLDNLPPHVTPLDPWGRTYLVAYNPTQKVMIIYSAGPNGKIETKAGDTTPAGDDILHAFR